QVGVDAGVRDASRDGSRDDASTDARGDAIAPESDRDGDGTADTHDCAPDDRSRWQTIPGLFRDADGDGYTVGGETSICAGGSAPGYTKTKHGEDCDDNDAARFITSGGYLDTDGDGVGEGALVSQCGDGSVMKGYAQTSGDCAPNDKTRWQSFS